MQTRRDQLNAHRYMVRRLNSALVDAEPDAPESPPRREAKTIIGSMLAGVLAIVVVGGWALLSANGSTAWQQPGTVIINKDSGSRYLLVSGVLRPVQSMSAARLALGQAVTTQVVSTSTLKNTPVGPPIGVPDTPDSLPAPKQLTDSGWTVCATPSTGAATPWTVVMIGPVKRTASQPLFVSDGVHTWLLWGGSRHLMAVRWAADAAGFASARPMPVAPSWVSLLPEGDAVQPPLVHGRGGAGATINGGKTEIGQLVVAGSNNYLVVEKGIAALTPLQAALVRGDPSVPAPRQVSEATIAAVPRQSLPVSAFPLPQDPVTPAAGDASCAVVTPSTSAAPSVSFSTLETEQRPGAAPDSGAGITAVVVAPGHGALVSPRPINPQQSAVNQKPLRDVYLVTDTGQAYPVGSVAALKALGYDLSEVRILPMAFVNLLQRGPVLQ